jgi:hypothetical protein
MTYTIEQIAETRPPFSSYRYRIFRDGVAFAVFSHDFRGECEFIQVLASGSVESPPFARCSDFLTGGGPLPLGLREAATRYLDTLG